MKSGQLAVICAAFLIILAHRCRGQDSRPCGADRFVLIYSGGPHRPASRVSELIRYVAAVDSAGQPRAWLTTGVILLDLQAPAGAYLTAIKGTKPATAADWEEYLDSLFAVGGVVQRFDSAVTRVESVLGSPKQPFHVVIMIPYPDPRSGTVRLWGRDFDLRTNEGRVGASVVYSREVMSRFLAGNFGQLGFEGFDWLMEGVGIHDMGVVRAVADSLHSMRTRFYWIPDFYDFTRRHWASTVALGFDQAWLQPNYFIDTLSTVARIDSALEMARAQGVGVEIEFDKRLFSSPVFAQRLGPYLVALDSSPKIGSTPLALYDGGGGLPQLADSRNPVLHRLYLHLAKTFGVSESAAKACK